MKMKNVLKNIFIMESIAVVFLFVLCVNFSPCTSDDRRSQTFGGFTGVDPNSEEVKKVASDGIAKLDGDAVTGRQCKREVRKVTKAERQSVSGSRYRMEVELCTPKVCAGRNTVPICDTCKLEILEQSRTPNFLRVEKLDCPKEKKWNHGTSQTVGGFSDVDPNNEEVKRVASAGIAKLDAKEPCRREVRKVNDAQKQAVSGTVHRMEVELCRPERCNGQQRTPICDTCKLEIAEKPWIADSLQVQKVDCPKEEKWNYENSQKFGGSTGVDPNSEEVKRVAAGGIAQLDAKEACRREIRKVIDAEKQTVSGTLHRIRVELCTPKSCKGQLRIQICDTCKLEILEKPWTADALQVQKVDCPKEKKWNYSYSQ